MQSCNDRKNHRLKSKYIIWGRGVRGKDVYDFLKGENIVAVIDSNPMYQGEYWNGVLVKGFDECLGKICDEIIIVTPVNYKGILEILHKYQFVHYLLYDDVMVM